jgi:hypothetical protein
MVESFVYLGIKNVNDYDLCFSDIVVACNTYGGKNLCSDLLQYGWTANEKREYISTGEFHVRYQVYFIK